MDRRSALGAIAGMLVAPLGVPAGTPLSEKKDWPDIVPGIRPNSVFIVEARTRSGRQFKWIWATEYGSDDSRLLDGWWVEVERTHWTTDDMQ